MKASETEIRALDEADGLQRFAAERVKDLDPDLTLAIAEARTALESDRWNPQISQRFWTAFAKFCELIQPVTTDCLAEGRRHVPAFRWLPWRGTEEITVAERSSARYLRIMIVLLATILPLQLYVWMGANLAKKVDGMFAETRTKVAQLTEDARQLSPGPAAQPRDDAPPPDERTAAIARRAGSLDIDMRHILDSVIRLQKLTTFASKIDEDGYVNSVNEVVGDAEKVAFQFTLLQRISWPIIDRANLLTGVIASFVLPILFGVIGAVAYIIRSISDQIRTATFSSTSPIRHIMRVALGALAGIVVGLFGELSNQLSLSPLAIAFLAGYGAEAVFSMFDGLIQKIRQMA
jgi:hypothetical protein